MSNYLNDFASSTVSKNDYFKTISLPAVTDDDTQMRAMKNSPRKSERHPWIRLSWWLHAGDWRWKAGGNSLHWRQITSQWHCERMIRWNGEYVAARELGHWTVPMNKLHTVPRYTARFQHTSLWHSARRKWNNDDTTVDYVLAMIYVVEEYLWTNYPQCQNISLYWWGG